MKPVINLIIAIVAMKLMVFLGIFSTNDTSIPIALKIDLTTNVFEAEINKGGYIKYDCEIIENKALINNELVEDLSIVEINGNEYIIDIKANYVELQEYKLIQRIVNNFRMLNKHSLYKWTFYIRCLIYIIAFFTIFEFKEGLFWTLIIIPTFTFLTFFIVNYLGWISIWGYITYLLIIIIDAIIGAIRASD